MSYAKLCKYGCNTQIVWNAALSKFKELESGQIHTQERCQELKGSGTQRIIYKTTSPEQQQQTFSPPKISPQFDDVKIANLITKMDNMNIALAQIMSNVANIIENAGTFKEMQELKTENQQLKEVIKKQNLSFQPANQIRQEVTKSKSEEFDQHVRDMVEKGKQETENNEELEL